MLLGQMLLRKNSQKCNHKTPNPPQYAPWLSGHSGAKAESCYTSFCHQWWRKNSNSKVSSELTLIFYSWIINKSAPLQMGASTFVSGQRVRLLKAHLLSVSGISVLAPQHLALRTQENRYKEINILLYDDKWLGLFYPHYVTSFRLGTIYSFCVIYCNKNCCEKM